MKSKPIIAYIDEILKPIGFFRKGKTWNRNSNPFIDVINLQISKSGELITINGGVQNPDISEKCWGKPSATFIDEAACIVRTRIGQLINDRDLWWPVDDAMTRNDVLTKITNYIIPFINSMHSLSAMEVFLEQQQVTKSNYPPPIIFLALLKLELGNKNEALLLLNDLKKRTVVLWMDKIDIILGGLV